MLSLLWGVQVYWGRRFVRLLKSRHEPAPDLKLPRALIVICLRGADPFLQKTLRALLNQTHTDFRLRLIIDSPSDAAWAIVNPLLEETDDPRLETQILTKRLATCGLKNSAVLQATTDLEDEDEIIIQVDADAVPYPNWLRDMLLPFADPRVGATSGLRWYAPTEENWGSVVRHYWGCSAMVQMEQFGMVWGGSMAFRRELFETTDLRYRWAHAFVDDLIVSNAVESARLEVRHVPVVLLNQESINLQDCFQFIRRQSIGVRLGHHSWLQVSCFAAISGLATSVNTFGMVTAAIGGDLLTSVIAFAGAAVYAIGFRSLMSRLDREIRHVVRQQGESVPLRKDYPFNKMLFTLIVYVSCWLSSALVRSVVWRGIRYEFGPGKSIRRLNDTPYLPQTAELAEASLI